MGGYMGWYIGACFSGNKNEIQNEIGFWDNENVIVICSTDKEKEMKLKKPPSFRTLGGTACMPASVAVPEVTRWC